jgi:cytoskeletal protein RodZ
VSPDGGAGWDEPPLDIQIPDDARELERDVLAYRRELRAKRRRSRLRRLGSPFAGQGTIMPLLASILAVCLVAGAMLSVATFSPAVAPDHHRPPTATASVPQGASTRNTPRASVSASPRPSASARTARTASPSAKSNPSSTASHNHPPGGP